MLIRRVGIIVCLLTMALSATAKKKTVESVVRPWQLPAPMYLADSIAFNDTATINYPMRSIEDDYSMSNAYNGNCLVSPLESRLFFSRIKTIDDPFASGYQPYVYTLPDVRFFRTNIPFSTISYDRSFTTKHEENQIKFMFTGNLNKRINLGTQLNYLNAVGHYANQAGKVFNGSVFGSYNGKNYSLQAAFTWSSLSNFDNGGIKNTDDLGGSLNPEDIPVRLNAMNGYRYLSGFVNHYYSITTERLHHDSVEVINGYGQKEKKDSVRVEYVPVTTFAHTIEVNNSNRRYIEQTAEQSFYDSTYFNNKATSDSSDVLTIKNTLSVTFNEEFNKWLRFGATVFAYNECQRHLVTTNDTTFNYLWTNNTFVGGALYKNRGKWVKYGFDGDVCVVGAKIGEFQVNGHVTGTFPIGKDSMIISANAYVKNETPSYYLQHYKSNHFIWDNEFQKTYRFQVGGVIAYPTKWVKPQVDVHFENLTRAIYFGSNGLPQQYGGNVQVLSADVKCDITTPWVNLENHVVYQYSSHQDVISLPMFTLYHNLYYHGTWWKALDAQMGVDMRFFTKYYAPVLNPATGQFCVQNTEQVGNYPILNVYANFYVRLIHLRFFAQYTHFNHLFMKSNPTYYAMPSYPMNPDVFRAGLAWHFYK